MADRIIYDNHKKGPELYSSMRPKCQVGDDFYDYFMIFNKWQVKVIADDCLTHANNLLCSESKGSCMIDTVFYGKLNLQAGEFEYSNGGHNPPLLISKNGEVIETETTKNTVIGYLEGHKYNSRQIILEPGDTLYTFTDGVTETMNPHRELYGQERLTELLSKMSDKSPQEINDKMESELTTFADGYYQSDDITMLVLKYGGEFLLGTWDSGLGTGDL